jgi:hypothetical protein
MSNNLQTKNKKEDIIKPKYDKYGNALCPYCKRIVIPGNRHFCKHFDETVEIGF